MSLRTFLLIDSLALDVAGIVLLVAGQTALGIIVLVVAALAFGGSIALGRRGHTGGVTRPGHVALDR